MNRKPRPTKSPYQIKEEHKVFAGRQKKTEYKKIQETKAKQLAETKNYCKGQKTAI